VSNHEAAADHVEDALASAVASVLECDERDVQVRVEAPRLADRQGRWRVALSFEDSVGTGRPTTDEDAQAALAEVPSDLGDLAVDAVADAGDGDLDRDAPVVAPIPSPASDDAGDEDAGDADVGASDRIDDEDRDDEDREVHEGASGLDDRDAGALEDEAEAAADFVEGLLDALDLPGDLRITYQDDHAEVEVIDVGSGALIGRRGQTLEAIQELLRCSLQREFQRRARVKVDVEGYRSRRLEKLIEKADEAIDAVLDTGEPERLEPMDVFERKAVHHRVAKVEGLLSRSQGREPARRVIIERG
jgi:spoIIIJ-associated protein